MGCITNFEIETVVMVFYAQREMISSFCRNKFKKINNNYLFVLCLIVCLLFNIHLRIFHVRYPNIGPFGTLHLDSKKSYPALLFVNKQEWNKGVWIFGRPKLKSKRRIF